jgi:hypothetical protein
MAGNDMKNRPSKTGLFGQARRFARALESSGFLADKEIVMRPEQNCLARRTIELEHHFFIMAHP